MPERERPLALPRHSSSASQPPSEHSRPSSGGATRPYRAAVSAARTQQQIISDLVDRLFGGSAARLVLHALSSRKTSPEELAEIQALVDRHRGGQS
jgi:predicted transcriptional regulator